MKLLEIAWFEISYQSRRAWTWVYFVALFGIVFQITAEAYSGNARTGGYFFNAPFVIAVMTILGTGMSLLVTAAISGEAGGRDVQSRMHPLVYTSSVSKGTYLRGRFLGAFLLNAVILLAVPLAILMTAVVPGVERDLIGPFQSGAYTAAYFVIALPTAFVATSLLFTISVLTRRPIASYLGGVLLFFLSMFAWQFVGMRMNQWELAKVIDPLGLTIIREISQTTTAAQKNTLSIASSGAFLVNRAIWLGVAFAVLAFVHARFRFAHPATASTRWRRRVARSEEAHVGVRREPIAIPRTHRTFGWATHMHQTVAIMRQSFREIAFSWGGLILVGLTTVLVVFGANAMNHMGVPEVPTTHRMTEFVGNSGEILWLIVPLLSVFYVGELVWRERETGLSEISDAAPVPEWSRFLGRYAGLALVLAAYQALLIAAAVLIQIQLGYYDFEFGLYVRVLLGLQLADHLLFAAMAFAVHVLVNQKYAGHMAVLVAFALAAFASSFGIEHKLLVYGAAPGWTYADMRGFEPSVAPWMWFKLYWGAWALLLAVTARLFWIRTREGGVAPRLQLARRRLTRSTIGVAMAAGALVLVAGGFSFYNTNVLNAYQTTSDRANRRVAYERKYARYRSAPQPTLTATTLRVEIYPERRAVDIRGTYRLVNKSGVAIDTIHVAPDWEVETGETTLDRPATKTLDDKQLGHRIYVLKTPLAAGDSLRLDFDMRFQPRGFTNSGVDPSVAGNGTFFDANDWLPDIGYQSERELAGSGERRTYGLAPRPTHKLEDVAARSDVTEAAKVALDVTVGTTDGQTGVAPGALQRTWAENGRRYFHYVTDVPIRNDFAIYSAKYAVRDAKWNDVSIQVLYHPGHAANVDRMVKSAQASLDYYTKSFGPYPYRQLRLVEQPEQGVTLHASPINIWYQERFALLDPEKDSRKLDFPFAVIAHEVAHSWWGNQVFPARVEGAALLSESLAWYSAMCVVRETYGDEHLRSLLGMMREAYLTPNSRAGVPLLRADGWYLAYRKGPFAMYALREYVGAERVNVALRRLVETYGGGTPPLPTSLDLLRELQAVTPDSLRYLLTDLLETNTFWTLKTTRATAEPAEGGNWRVTLDFSAKKAVVDTVGNETDVPMNDLVEIGVYGEDTAPLYLRQHRVRSAAQRITIVVPRKPGQAGIDPRNLLIDTRADDNVRDVVTGK